MRSALADRLRVRMMPHASHASHASHAMVRLGPGVLEPMPRPQIRGPNFPAPIPRTMATPALIDCGAMDHRRSRRNRHEWFMQQDQLRADLQSQARQELSFGCAPQKRRHDRGKGLQQLFVRDPDQKKGRLGRFYASGPILLAPLTGRSALPVGARLPLGKPSGRLRGQPNSSLRASRRR